MKASNRIALLVSMLTLVGLLPAVLDVPVNAGEIKKVQPNPVIGDLVAFKVHLEPDDPFDPANAQDHVGKWQARRGQIVRVVVTGTLTDGYHTYPITQRTSQQEPGQLTIWTMEPVKGITPLWPLLESPPQIGKIPATRKSLAETYFELDKEFTWSQDVFVAQDAPTGNLTVPIKLHIQICRTSCATFDHTIPVSIDISPDAPLPMSDSIADRLKFVRPPVTVVPTDDPTRSDLPAKAKPDRGSILGDSLIRSDHEAYKKSMADIAEQFKADNAKGQSGADLLGFILAGIFWGAISLITPCVFPMIPITVSFFLKQSEKEHHRPIVMASVYSLTIVVVLTLAAAFLLSIFRMLSIHPATNYFIGGLFVFFALSLFGMYEIELPSSLAQFTSSREGKGGLIGTIFMALTFTVISFACVAPFLGGFSGTAAAARPWWHNLLGGLAFSATFASPFFFLALFPALLRKLPKSGSWLNSVKVVMGFLELAAAFKFFRTAELIQTAATPSFFTFDFVLALWIAMSVLCGLYLIGLFRLPHDTPEQHVGVPRLLFAAAFIGLALYLTPALFKVGAAGQAQRPGGSVYAWIDSFLLPESVEGDAEVIHTANLEYAVAQARETYKSTGKPKRIFIDFTGVSCTNCKLNEREVFSKSQIQAQFEPYIFVKLYTDTVPPKYYSADIQAALAQNLTRSEQDAKNVNLLFQKRVFDTEELPLYAVIEPQLDNTIRVIGLTHGRINNEAVFAEFLKSPDDVR